ncbi:CHAT domain-containing protein [Mycena vulgaris]|nr:CHAT domain-containing protein [Mycena vulgaris]
MDIDLGSINDTASNSGADNNVTSDAIPIPEELGIKELQQLVDQTPREDPDLPRYQHILGKALINRYRDGRNLPDLHDAVKNLQEAVDLTPAGDTERAGRLQSLALPLCNRYRELGDLNDLQAALQADQEALELTPEGHPDRPGRLQNVAMSLGDRYWRLGDLNDLEAALQAERDAVRSIPDGHPNRASCLQNLGVSLRERYKRLGDLEDLEAGLQAGQEALELTPKEDSPNRARRLQNLAISFKCRYQRLGDLNDLEAGLRAEEEALGLTPKGDPNRAGHLQNLAMSLKYRYQTLGELEDLEAAFRADQEALKLTPEGHPERAERLQNLAVSFADRYRRLGDLNDLEAGFQAEQEAVRLTPEGHPGRARRLQNLAVSFRDRYRRLGDLNDLEAALRIAKEAVQLTPAGDPERALWLRNLAVSLTDRYQRLGNLNDLEAAVQTNQDAVGLTPEGHPDKADWLQSLAVSLRERYHRIGDLSDLKAALQASLDAVGCSTEGSPDRAGRLQTLALSLRAQYSRLGDVNDLEAALQADQEAVKLSPDGSRRRAGHIQSLALSLTEIYRRFSRPEDLDSVHSNYILSFKTPTSTPESSWDAALRWASFSEECQSAHAMTAYYNAFQLLPDILWIGNLLPVRHEATHRLEIGEATSAAARTFTNFSNFLSAVEIIEQGVGITFQQMLQLKTDMGGIPSAQARQLQVLSSELYSGTSSNLQDTANKRQKLLDDIRKQPGLEHFLRPKPYTVLSHASQGGPVIMLNSHQDHCDGIVILDPASDPVHVSLPNVTLALLKSQGETLRQLLTSSNLLTWLYNNVVFPVYQTLDSVSHGIHNGRLWWLPTGAFSGLPLHACPPTSQFIHSYTATLGSLLDAYSKESHIPPKVGVVGVTHTGSGGNRLPGVEQEVKKIMSIIKTSHVECLEGPQATPDAVKLQLQDCSWVHLACHGKQDLLEPTKSHLMLYQGVLELDTILHMPLSNAEFVFLAACQTAMGDSQLINESFHLGGGFIAAGFRSAIGTLWSMNDRDGPLVAEKVYSHLFQEGQQPQASDTAEALQLAVEELKAQKVPYERWIPFIHMGI